MKTVSQETKNAINQFLELNAKWKNSYFWSGFGNSADRAYKEKQNCMQYEGDGITLDWSVSLSRNNAYISRTVIIDGVKKTAAALKKFVK